MDRLNWITNKKIAIVSFISLILLLAGCEGDPITEIYIDDLYAATGRTATFVVAASDASATSKAQADYVCDGTADDVEINAAIAAASSGDVIYFAEGTYNISATIISSKALSFIGAPGAEWFLINSANCNMFSGLFKMFANLELNGNRSNQGVASHLIVGTGGADIYIVNCLIWQGNGDGLRIVNPASSMWTWRITGTTFENFTNYGVNIQQSNNGLSFRNLQISNNYFWNCRDGGIYLVGNGQNIKEIMISGSRIGYSNDSLIEADDCLHINIIGNILDSPGQNAADNDAGVYLNDCLECVISGNNIFNSLNFTNAYGIDLQGTTDRITIESNNIYDSGASWLGSINLGASNNNGLIRNNVGYYGVGDEFIINKQATETVNNSAVLQNDDELILPVNANEVWLVYYYLQVTSNATADFSCGFSVPAGTTMNWNESASGVSSVRNEASVYSPATTTAAIHLIRLECIIMVGGNTGNINLQWAQLVAHASDTQVLANSQMIAKRIE